MDVGDISLGRDFSHIFDSSCFFPHNGALYLGLTSLRKHDLVRVDSLPVGSRLLGSRKSGRACCYSRIRCTSRSAGYTLLLSFQPYNLRYDMLPSHC